jgi:hypothetical protein
LDGGTARREGRRENQNAVRRRPVRNVPEVEDREAGARIAFRTSVQNCDAWALACAIAADMLPVVSIAMMMSAEPGSASRCKVFATLADPPAATVTFHGLGVNVSAAKAGTTLASEIKTSAAATTSRRHALDLVIPSSFVD